MCEISSINSLFDCEYDKLLSCCSDIIKKNGTYIMDSKDLLHETYFELIRKRDKIECMETITIPLFYSYAKNLCRHKYRISHISKYVYITNEKDIKDNEIPIERFLIKDEDVEYLSETLNKRAIVVCEIIKNTIYENIFNYIKDYNSVGEICNALNIKRDKVVTYMHHLTELSNFLENNPNPITMSNFLEIKGYKKKTERKTNIKFQRTKNGDKGKQCTIYLDLNLFEYIKARSELLEQSITLTIVNDLKDEYKSKDLYNTKSEKSRKINGSEYKQFFPIFPQWLVNIIDERSTYLNNTRSNQICFDLKHYYNKLENNTFN